MRDEVIVTQGNHVKHNICWRAAVLVTLAVMCPVLGAQTGQWVWMGGSSRTVKRTTATNVPADGLPGVYGTLGNPSAGNRPGARKNASSWTDSSGNFWLFGGGEDTYGHDQPLIFNDLWEFNPSTREWTWMGGSSKSGCKGCGQRGVYGTLGTGDAGNIPGSRKFASTWIDDGGNFWIYGGGGYDSARNLTILSDLWKFSPSTQEWTWIAGKDPDTGLGSCDTFGTPDDGNNPGFREFSVSWSDNNGNLWLFGGWGFVTGIASSSSGSGDLNDLWMFDPSTGEWTCSIGRSRTVSERGDHGGWTDNDGHLWLFGGQGRDSTNIRGFLNDLWEFDPETNEWAWIGGDNVLPCRNYVPCSSPGVYGKIGKSASGNIPGGRHSASSWTDNNGNFWLFGGHGTDSKGDEGDLNDLWTFNPSTQQWTWMSGNKTAGPYLIQQHFENSPKGVYGKLGVPASTNIPGGRFGASSWTDRDGNLWLFGGEGLDSNGDEGYLNDLWEYRFYQEPVSVDIPTFSVPEGAYVSIQYVKITDIMPDSAIYYTLDGSTPTDKSTKYIDGITIDKSTTVKAIAIANGYDNSDVATATYMVFLPISPPTQ